MGSQKRKRESYATPTSNDAEASSNTPETSHPTTQVTNVPFKVEFVKPGDVKPKRRRTSGKEKLDYSDHTVAREEPGITPADKSLTYMIIPGSTWESLKKYKNFIVSEKQFGVNDYVYVNYGQVAQGEETEDDKQFWVARVLEVRASSPSAVYLRIFWMYWPSELPAGPEYYHGKNELVASNHMEIIDAMTVSGKAEVMHLVEKDDAPTVTGLYWRQKYDFLTRKVSALKRDCTCKQYHNPDKLLIHCVNPACGKWMHEDCIVKDASEKAWMSLTKPKVSEEPGSDTIEVNGDADNNETIQVAAKGSETRGTPIAVNGAKSKPGRGHWKRKSKGKKVDIAESIWSEKIEAKLEKQIPVQGEDESTDITGKVILKDLRDEDSKTWDEVATCLFCHTPLQ